MTRVLAISADRSKRGVLVPGSAAYQRQRAYAEKLGALDIVGFSLEKDGFTEHADGTLRLHPTRSITRLFFGIDAIHTASRLPWPDVVSAQDPFETGLAALMISRSLKIPLHIQVHTDFLSPEYASLSLMNRIRVFLAGVVLRRASRVRVVSDRIRQSILKAYDIKVPITVLPIFADVRKFADATAPAELKEKFSRFNTKLLFIGRLEREKDPAAAIRAYAQSAPTDACLIIVGGGTLRPKLERLAKDMNVHDRVFFEGETDAVPYMALADLVLVPSRYEGYGLTIVESLAAGKPVLATDVGIARDAGAIVSDRASYAASLRSWFENGPQTGALTAYPYASVDEYIQAYCDDIRACVRG